LLELAAIKDRGFTRATFLDALRAIARLGTEDWAEDGVSAETAVHLRSLFGNWQDELVMVQISGSWVVTPGVSWGFVLGVLVGFLPAFAVV
jgi:hypothetical protein